MRWVQVQEIYADGKHNAWPDMCRWRGRYYVTFSSGGKGHANGHGICILSSADGRRWEKQSETPGEDWVLPGELQRGGICPKLLPTEDRLIVMAYYYDAGETDVPAEEKDALRARWRQLGGSGKSFERWLGHHDTSFRTALRHSADGRSFSSPLPMLEPGWRVWRPHSFGGRHYVVGYRCHGQTWSIGHELEKMIPRADRMEMFESASLFASEDGLSWEEISDIGTDDNDEPDFDFTESGRVLVVSRTGASMTPDRPAMAYVSDPPYAEWRRVALSAPLNAPAVRRVGDRWVVAGRARAAGFSVPSRFAPESEEDIFAPTRLWFLEEETGRGQCVLTRRAPRSYPLPDGPQSKRVSERSHRA